MKDKESNQIDTLLRVTLGGNSFPIKDFEGLFFPRKKGRKPWLLSKSLASQKRVRMKAIKQNK